MDNLRFVVVGPVANDVGDTDRKTLSLVYPVVRRMKSAASGYISN